MEADVIGRSLASWVARWARYAGRAAPEADFGTIRASTADGAVPGRATADEAVPAADRGSTADRTAAARRRVISLPLHAADALVVSAHQDVAHLHRNDARRSTAHAGRP